MPRSGGKRPKADNGEKSKPEDSPVSSSETSSADDEADFPVTAERYSTLWMDEIETRDQLRAFRELKAKRANRMNYDTASRMGAALAERVSDKPTAEAITVIFAQVASGTPPAAIVKLLRLWGPPLEFFMGVVVAMETDLRSPDCDVSALKVELAKAMLDDAETTERPQ